MRWATRCGGSNATRCGVAHDGVTGKPVQIVCPPGHHVAWDGSCVPDDVVAPVVTLGLDYTPSYAPSMAGVGIIGALVAGILLLGRR